MQEPNRDSEGPFQPVAKPLLLVLSGPSGAGKDAVLYRMKELELPLEFIITVTTRPRRASERDNMDYHFVSRESFQKMIDNGELLEWANVYGNWYGVPQQPVKQELDRNRITIVKVVLVGGATI